MTAQNRSSVTWQSADPTDTQCSPIEDRSQQGREMLTMLLAMLVMVLGLPLHITGLSAHGDHGAGVWSLILSWLSTVLTFWTFWIARQTFCRSWQALRRMEPGSAELVIVCALAALLASVPSLINHNGPMYFDVAAMTLAWLVAGEAQAGALRWRATAILEQLAPLNLEPRVAAAPDPARIDRVALLAGTTILVFAIGALGWQALLGGGIAHGVLVALSLVAVGCPCTLGIVRSAAWEAGVERAARAGWLVPSGEALGLIDSDPALATRLAVAPGPADPATLVEVARAVDRAIRWNYLWAIGFNLGLLPLALFMPMPALVPAATMVLARLLIGWTIRRLELRP